MKNTALTFGREFQSIYERRCKYIYWLERPEHEVQRDNILPPQSVFNTVCTAGEILGGNMPKGLYQLKDAYLSLFQPDPALQGYGPPPPKLNNSCFGPLALQLYSQCHSIQLRAVCHIAAYALQCG